MKHQVFNQRKATEAAAYLLNKSPGKQEYLLLIIKLLYIAERRSLQKRGSVITWDHFVSMDHGPVMSHTYNLISGSERDSGIWDTHISTRQNHQISLIKMPEIQELSKAELKILEEVYNEFGSKDRWEVVDLTHSFSEWKDPDGSALPIEFEDILKASDTPADTIEAIKVELEASAHARAMFAID